MTTVKRTCSRNWTSGCRCDHCHGRLLERSRMRRAVRAVASGRDPEVRVPAARARRLLAKLRARGLSIRAIAELSGVSIGALQHLQQRDRVNVSVVTERRLAAVVR